MYPFAQHMRKLMLGMQKRSKKHKPTRSLNPMRVKKTDQLHAYPDAQDNTSVIRQHCQLHLRQRRHRNPNLPQPRPHQNPCTRS